MKHTFTTLILCCLFSFSFAQTAIQSPAEFLGYGLGNEFTRHHQVINYFNHLSENSSLLNFDFYGTTNEGRQLSYAILSSEENLKNIEEIRTQHLMQTGIIQGKSDPEIAVIWLSYNVHGNEASGTEAAMQTAYELVTNQRNLLKNTVIILDPCINPDGRDRYVNWYKQVKASPYNAYQDAVEHQEPWVSGRPNHYLFDLNRDWMWATQVETQQRLKLYNQWMPHLHVDFHEQGINQPYYFAPAAEPFHEMITDFQRKFQIKIGKNNAKTFDNNAWAYFTRESFDLFYPSYGDTYPTYNGAIGMTYEQAGNGQAGLGINTDGGYELTLKDRIQHHVLSGITTVQTASNSAKELNIEFKAFFTNTSAFDYYILAGEEQKLNKLAQLFDLHDIKYAFAKAEKLKATSVFKGSTATFKAENAMVLAANQPKSRLLKILFEADPKLRTPITYDITSWNLALAHGLDLYTYKGTIETKPEKEVVKNIKNGSSTVGYIAPWKSMAHAKFLSQLLQHGIEVKAATKSFEIENETHPAGSLVITRTNNQQKNLDSLLIAIADTHQLKLITTSTSFSNSGTDFGSPDIKKVHPQRIAVLRGEGISTLSYGAIWYFFEQELKYPIISIPTENFSKIDLSNYDVLILPNGRYSSVLNEKNLETLSAWVKKGGKTIAMGGALSSFIDQQEFGLEKFQTKEDSSTVDFTPYAQRKLEQTKNNITGAIFKIKVDDTHPLAFGYSDQYYTLKTSAVAYPYLKKGYNVAYLDNTSERVSGFVGEKAAKEVQNSLVFGEFPLGKGSMIYMVDEVTFRSFWENGKLFLANALFMVNNNSQEFR
jgi:hypothetical protein